MTPGPPILIADDDPDVRALTAMTLSLEGYQVITAANGQQGWDFALRLRPGLVVLDMMMPVMDGADFFGLMASEETLSQVPVLVCSGSYEACSRAKAMGAAGCMTKPVDFREFVARVAGLYRERF